MNTAFRNALFLSHFIEVGNVWLLRCKYFIATAVENQSILNSWPFYLCFLNKYRYNISLLIFTTTKISPAPFQLNLFFWTFRGKVRFSTSIHYRPEYFLHVYIGTATFIMPRDCETIRSFFTVVDVALYEKFCLFYSWG